MMSQGRAALIQLNFYGYSYDFPLKESLNAALGSFDEMRKKKYESKNCILRNC